MLPGTRWVGSGARAFPSEALAVFVGIILLT